MYSSTVDTWIKSFLSWYRRGGYAMKQTSFRHQQLYTSYHAVKTLGITSPITSLSSCKKPISAPLPHSWNVNLSNAYLNERVVWGINITTDFLALKFYVYFIHIYKSRFLHLQLNQASSTCPVKDEFGGDSVGAQNSGMCHDRVNFCGWECPQTRWPPSAKYTVVWIVNVDNCPDRYK